MTVFPHWQIYKYACLAVSLFDCIMAWQTGLSPDSLLLTMTVVSGAAYLVIKYIKRNTGLLDEKGR